MPNPRLLSKLAERAVQFIHYYDADAASLALHAIGEMNVCEVHAPQLLRQLAPTLPTYTHKQLTLLLDGLSLLRVSHYMMTAHVLRLFLLSLTPPSAAQTCNRSAALLPRDSMSWQEKVRAMASMARVLQRRNTQRTVRAFLAAADRACAEHEHDEKCAVDAAGAASLRGAKQPSRPVLASISHHDRRAAVQLLYLVEVYVNSSICVSAPQTPVWLLQMLERQSFLHAFTLRELLHIHTRLFVSESDAGFTVCDLESSDSPLYALLLKQCAFIVDVFANGEDENGVYFDDLDSLGHMPSVAPSTSSAGCELLRVRRGEHLRRGLTERERLTVARCAVWRRVACDRSGDMLRSRYGGGFVASLALDEVLLSLVDASVLCRLTHEFCRELCAASLDWWLGIVAAYHEASAAWRHDGQDGGLTSSEADAREHTLLSISLLQLLQAQRVVLATSQTDKKLSPVKREHSLFSAEEEKEVQGTMYLPAACSVLHLLCVTLPACCLDAPLQQPQPLLEVVPEAATLLLLLLHATDGMPLARCEGGEHKRWPLWASSGQGRVTELREDKHGEAGKPVKDEMWSAFCAARKSVIRHLLGQWCNYWVVQESASFSCSGGLPRKNRHAGSEEALQVHWGIADILAAAQSRAANSCGDELHCDRFDSVPSCGVGSSKFHAVFRVLVDATVSHFSHSRRCSAAFRRNRCGSTSRASAFATDLKTDLTCVLAGCLLEAQPSGLCAQSVLTKLLSQSPLPRYLSDAFEMAENDEAFPRAFSSVSPLCCAPSNDEGGETAEHSQHWQHWRDRVWWVHSTSLESNSMTFHFAVELLLHSAFVPRREAGPAVSACLFKGGAADAHDWLLSLLIVYLQRLSAHFDDSAVAEIGLSRLPCSRADALTDLNLHRLCVESLALRNVDGIPQFGSPFHLPSMRTQGFSMPQWREAQRVAPPPPPFLTSNQSGFSDTLMCNIETFWNWGSSALVCDTLREGVREAAPSALQSSSSAAVQQHRLWYRDDHVITLVRCSNKSSQASYRRHHHSYPPSCSSGLKKAVHLEHLFVNAVQMIDAALSCFLVTARSGGDLKNGVASAQASERPADHYPDRDDNAGWLSRLDAAPILSSNAFMDLLSSFWGYCRRLLALHTRKGVSGETLENAQRCRHQTDVVVLAAIRRWRGYCVVADVPHHSPDMVETCRDGGFGYVPHNQSNTISAARDVFSLLLPHIWTELHASPTSFTTRPLAMAGGGACGDVPETVLDVWRLEAFCFFWSRHLPLSAACASAHERLLHCLYASCANAAIEGQQGKDAEELLRGTIVACEKALMYRDGVVQVACPFQFLNATMEKLGQTVVANKESTVVQEGFDNCQIGAIVSLNTLSVPSTPVVHDLSAVDIYVRVLLREHPFVLEDRIGAEEASAVPRVRLVVVTWMHVLLIQSIVAHHPQVFFRGSATRFSEDNDDSSGGAEQKALNTNVSSLSIVRAALQRLSAYETRLFCRQNEVRADHDAMEQEKQRLLLHLCLVRELRAALLAMESTNLLT